MTTWLIACGIVLVILGVVLRVVLMMRSSDATTTGGQVLHGRELLRHYRTLFPQSTIPYLMQAALLGGAILLVLGIGRHLFYEG